MAWGETARARAGQRSEGEMHTRRASTYSALHVFTSSGFARMISFVHAFRIDGSAGGTAICSAEKMRCSIVWCGARESGAEWWDEREGGREGKIEGVSVWLSEQRNDARRYADLNVFRPDKKLDE